MQDRMDIAIEFMKEGKAFRVGDLRLGANNSNDIEVAGWSNYSSLKNITKPIAKNELEDIKTLFSEMLNESSKLRKFVDGKNIKFVLSYDDGGKGSIEICTEENGDLKWIMPLK
jgi:hypothetical protein